MSLQKIVSDEGNTVAIRIGGRFDFQLHREFRDAYRSESPAARKYVVDLKGTEYMDSSALGMLLLLREHAGGDRAEVDIVNCGPEIKQILTISNFHQLFNIQ
jgi:anti-anti-sigma factor